MTLLEHKDRIIKEILKPLFKEKGFNTSGVTFIKKESGFIKIFNIQSSAFNQADSVSFYLNMGILFPIWLELQGKAIPSKPKEYECQFRIRTNAFPGCEQSYDIDPETDIEALETLVKNDTMHHIFPFFDRYNNISDCATLHQDYPKGWTDCRPFVGLTMIKNGEIEAGNLLIDEFIPTTSENWGTEIENLRKSLL